MKKKVVMFGTVIVAAAILVAVMIDRQTPTAEDFNEWMESTYAIECQDKNCGVFRVETETGKKVLMQTARGSYSTGPFMLEVDRVYRNVEDASYYLKIHVKGFMNQLTLEDEVIQSIEKKES